MTLNKKILATAIVGGLFASAAQAQVNLSATGGSTAVTYASELIVANPTTGLDLTAAAANELQSNLRYNFSSNEVRFVRIECASNIRFAAGTTVALAAGSGVATDLTGATIGSVNGIGTNVITFSVTSGTGLLKSGNQIVIGGPRNITSTAGGACSYSLYDQPSQAAAGGAAGLITTVSGPYLAFAPSYTLRVQGGATGAVADVSASPSFSTFVNSATASALNANASLGNVRFDLVSLAGATPTPAQPLLADGALPASLATFIGTGSNHVVTGDFSLAANADGTYTGAALSRVYFATSAACPTAGAVSASALTASTATFNINATPVNLFFCVQRRSGNLITASTYTQSFNAVSAAPTVYSATNRGPVSLGSITRNGSELQAPLVQVPAGWLSRIALTNTSSVARAYNFTAQSETGTTVALGSAATGTIPANGTVVLSVADIATFTGQPRGTLNVSIAAPTEQIQGLYQIVNPASGSISNHVMVRPGSN